MAIKLTDHCLNGTKIAKKYQISNYSKYPTSRRYNQHRYPEESQWLGVNELTKLQQNTTL